ncbi:MAG: hypothetical protein A3K19_26955 [Lentisphaerae bacterium RIFOXYB12_FULL_65_16]|nr:MAG: hypothetical protein A3K18_23930 [Lentisphaerae bacterium RIFOXYA12_64_32]OGV88041.1 MAG: hypothetical protein A3K19_26955 [Lentisphaerae bacterium RIFOXYB12_FULL_65_16]
MPAVSDGEKHLILVVDDLEPALRITVAHLKAKGYRTLAATRGEPALELAREQRPDLLLLDVNMPGMSGLEVCRRLKQDPATQRIPVIMMTANNEIRDIVVGFESGADDYLTKPYHELEMHARIRSMLRMYDAQRELDELNRNLERKVSEQVREIERANRLKRFFSPQIVQTILAENAESRLRDHRQDVTVVFLDLRRFTPFSERATPEEVIQTIRELHGTVGPVIFRHGATVERFVGDGIMMFMGDPEPMPDHALRAVSMCVEIRSTVEVLRERWQARGFPLGLGIGVATGRAVLGLVGFEGRVDYTALGSVTNLAARLCGEADGGQILISESTRTAIGDAIPTVPCGQLQLKGFSSPQAVFQVA